MKRRSKLLRLPQNADFMVYKLKYNLCHCIKGRQCQFHDYTEISAICINFSCDSMSRLVCQKCLVDNHDDHTLISIKDSLKNKQELFKIIEFLYKDTQSINVQEVNWLRETILEGQQQEYPQLSVDWVMNEIQSQFISKMDELRSQIEQSVYSNKSLQSAQQVNRIMEFKANLDHIMRQSHSQINLVYQNTFQNDSLDLCQQSVPLSTTMLKDLPDQTTEEFQFTDKTSIQEEVIPDVLLPTFKFVDKTPKKWLGKPAVTYQSGDKIITCNKGLLLSSEAFNGIVEVRLKVLSLITSCVHIGVLEESMEELKCNFENVGIWGCLNQACSRSQPITQVNKCFVAPEQIVSLGINTKADILTIKLWSNEAIQVLHQRQGALMNQKYKVFITTYDCFKFELIN